MATPSSIFLFFPSYPLRPPKIPPLFLPISLQESSQTSHVHFMPTYGKNKLPSKSRTNPLPHSTNDPRLGRRAKRTRHEAEEILIRPRNWVQHRSSFRHVRHFLSSLNSRVILSLVPPVIVFTSVAAIIAGYNTSVSMQWLPEFFPVLSASSLPYQLTAPASALLLVFRTEASYSRFEEGKKAWTKMIAGINDFAMLVIDSVKSPSDAALKNAILRYIIAFPVALKCHIVYDSEIAKDLQNMLEMDDLAMVLSSKHHPNCILGFISQSLQLLDMEDTKRHLLSNYLGQERKLDRCSRVVYF